MSECQVHIHVEEPYTWSLLCLLFLILQNFKQEIKKKAFWLLVHF